MLNAGTNNDKPKIEQDPKKAPKTTEQISKDEIKLRKRLRGVDISPIDLIFTIRHLALILKSGLPIGEAIGSVAGQSSNKKLNEVFGQIDRDVHEGKNLHDALAYYPKVFPQIAISIIKIGEEAGTLEKNLMFLTDYLKKKYELNKKIKGALFYPLVIMGMAFLEIAGVIFFVLPRMESLFMGFKNVPEFTLGIFAMTRFLRENILLLFAGLVVIIILVVLFLRTNPGKIFIDKLSLRFPVMNKLFRASILANIPRTLGILLSSGIPITQAVQTAYETIGNYEYENILKKVSVSLSEGKKLSTLLYEYPRYFPKSFIKMVEIGEETGTLEENLSYLHEFYSDEVNDISNNLTTLIEPIMLVFLGVVIALLAISVIGPIYQLTSSING
jgi:type II secretory pathway component PulF